MSSITYKEGCVPKIAVLSSYHGERAEHFKQTGDQFKPLNVDLVHPPSFKLLNPDDVFVFREGDPHIPNHLLQIQELRRMRELQNERLGNGFGYVVNEDQAVGMHTAGEMAFLALHDIPIASSQPLNFFRDIPLFAQNILKRTIQEILPISQITQESITALQERLAQQQPPSFTREDRKNLSNLVRNALLEQRFGEEGLYRALVTSQKGIKKRPFKHALEQIHKDRYIALDTVTVHIPNIPNQPFQEQGKIGVLRRIEYARERTAGFPYRQIGSFENGLVALDPVKFQSNAWATPDCWASEDMIALKPHDLIYADVAFFALGDMTGGKIALAYSRPVIVPTVVALEALRRGPDTLYAQVLQDKNPMINLDDPHSSLGNYSREQQLYDVAHALIIGT